YLADCGAFWSGHDGDSEFVIIEAAGVDAANGPLWGVLNVTFSAHWHAGWGTDATATYSAQDLQFPGGPNVRVWASEDKHANYRSKAVCDSGPNGWHTDDCMGN